MVNGWELILSLFGNTIGAGLCTAFLTYVFTRDTAVADYWLYIFILVFLLLLVITVAIALWSVHRDNKRYEKELKEQYDFIDSL